MLLRLLKDDSADRLDRVANRIGNHNNGWDKRARGFIRKDAIHATASPTIRDLEWAAGFLEGEGSFTKSAYKIAAENRVASTVRVTATQMTLEPLERLQRIFGGKVSRVKDRPSHGVGVWHWYTSGVFARGIMMTLYSLLSPRRQAQIRGALDKPLLGDADLLDYGRTINGNS